MDQRFEQTAFYPADILLPQTAEMKKWPVVACDQFTSQPDYWQAAEAAVSYELRDRRTSQGEIFEANIEMKVKRGNHNERLIDYMDEFDDVTIASFE